MNGVVFHTIRANRRERAQPHMQRDVGALDAQCIERTVEAMKDALKSPRRVTHVGLGEATVEKVASSRRVALPDGRVDFNRYSASGRDPFHSGAPDGLIDPKLKTLSLWDGDTQLVEGTVARHQPAPDAPYG